LTQWWWPSPLWALMYLVLISSASSSILRIRCYLVACKHDEAICTWFVIKQYNAEGAKVTKSKYIWKSIIAMKTKLIALQWFHENSLLKNLLSTNCRQVKWRRKAVQSGTVCTQLLSQYLCDLTSL
jgi:hypothetical protein